MKHKTTIGVLFFLAALAPLSNAADVSLDHLNSFTAEFDFYAGDEPKPSAKVGTWSDSVTTSEGNIIRTVERRDLKGNTDMTRTVVATTDTLAPVLVNQRFGDGLQTLFYSNFEAGKLQQFYLPNAHSKAMLSEAALPESVKETGLHGFFAAALPLGQSNQMTVETYMAGRQPKAVSMKFEVIGEEQITYRSHSFSAWKVHQPDTQWTYWVRREMPYLVKVSHPAPDGSMLTSYLREYKTQ